MAVPLAIARARIQSASARFKQLDNAVDIVDTAAPGAAAGILQGGPEPGIVRQPSVRRQRWVDGATRQHSCSLLWAVSSTGVADEVNGAGQVHRIHHNADGDLRRYPGDVLIRHEVIERLTDGASYQLLDFGDLTEHERAVLVELCDARLQIFLAGERAAVTDEGGLGPGRVYILKSEATPSLFKVGFTTVRATYRASEISRGTGVPAPFEVYYESVHVPDAYDIEQAVLSEFDDARPNRRKEFLEIRVLGDVIERFRARGATPEPTATTVDRV